MLAPLVSSAQTAEALQQQILHEQQQREQNLRDRIEQQQKQHQSFDLPSPASSDSSADGPCFDIDTILLDGADHLSPSEQETLTTPFSHQCLNLNAINQLLK